MRQHFRDETSGLTITVSGIEPPLEEAQHQLAEQEGISINRAALKLLLRGANLERPRERSAIGSDLGQLFGTWKSRKPRSFLLRSVPANRSMRNSGAESSPPTKRQEQIICSNSPL
jgi:hypothetical protein